MSHTTAQPPRKTLEQRRALYALDFVKKSKSEADWEDTKRLAKQLPVRIMTAGLGHALAFTENKGGKTLVGTLSDWINTRIATAGKPTGILERITNGDASFLRHATDETLAVLVWINRFAEATDVENSPDENAQKHQGQGIRK